MRSRQLSLVNGILTFTDSLPANNKQTYNITSPVNSSVRILDYVGDVSVVGLSVIGSPIPYMKVFGRNRIQFNHPYQLLANSSQPLKLLVKTGSIGGQFTFRFYQ